MSLEIGHAVVDLADRLEANGQSFYGNQMRQYATTVSGILASGSGAATKSQFADCVGNARQTVLEIANLALFYGERELISSQDEADLLGLIKRESKMLENFRQSLLRKDKPSGESIQSLV